MPTKSNRFRAADKTTPNKPHPDFPLPPRRDGRWCKTVRGKIYYFGCVRDDPDGQAALAEWLRVKDDSLAGRTSTPKGGDLTVKQLCNEYLNAKRGQMEAGHPPSATAPGGIRPLGRPHG